MVRMKAIITQLVFNHALRIRVKAELPEGAEASPIDTLVTEVEGSNTAGNGTTLAQSNFSSESMIDSNKGKQKARTSDAGDNPALHKTLHRERTADNLVGKINNLVTTDLGIIMGTGDFLLFFIVTPLQIALSVWFLYSILGWSAYVGLAVLVLMFPLPGYFMKLTQSIDIELMKKTDARVQTITEIMNVLRMIKLFGWENKMNARISDKREEELKWIRKRNIIDVVNTNLGYLTPLAAMVATYTTFTLIMNQELNASTVFSSMSAFGMLGGQLHMVFSTIPGLIQGKVSLGRINDFLVNTELLDCFTTESNNGPFESSVDDARMDPCEIGFRQAVFSWSNVSDGTLTPSRQQFSLRIEDELLFKPGRINLIVGPTASGKTSLLMALLGEMHYIPLGPNSSVNLPRSGGVAYAAQESWVQNETIRKNIIFGSEFDEERYKKVIFQCGLSHDLELFDAGDETEVGEKGLTLSGGQKARVTLARAIYSTAEILLLDDILAALDVHTAKHIVDQCLAGDLVKGRTVILVTHNVVLVSPIAHFVASLGVDGRILSQGSISETLARDSILVVKAVEGSEILGNVVDELGSTKLKKEAVKGNGKLIVAEEIQEGHVSWKALMLLVVGLGGDYPALFWIVFLTCTLLTTTIDTIETWWLGFWARQYDQHPSSDISVSFYLSGFALIVAVGCVCYSAGYLTFIFGTLRASKSIHKVLVDSVLGTNLRWLDKTPTSRVISRCTQDIQAVDGHVPHLLESLVFLSVNMLIKLGAIILFTPIFLIPGALIAIFGAYLGQLYIKAQLSVKREMSNAQSPVLGHFGAAISGLVSIRAYGTQDMFKNESLVRIDRYSRAARTFFNLHRWINIRVDMLGALFSAALATYLVYGGGATPLASNIGFSLNMAVSFSAMILSWVTLLNAFEVSGNSLERIQDYINIEQEPKSSAGGQPPAYWPASGDIVVENLSARYSPDGPAVLHNLSFHVRSGERIGIVGRTGSGKSSLMLSLLRCIPTEGTVYYDGLPTSSLNLDALRSNITVIPQVPELLAGSLRQNLDPFDLYDDAALNDALRAAGLFSLQSQMDIGRITLDSPISAGGTNLSVGQRQILALARAIVHGNKLLILDEATSAIDYKTDAVIQTSLRDELARDVTIITIAHRLQTVMDADKIMVLDAGHIVEFDSPFELLMNEKSKLHALVEESGDKENLFAIAEGKVRNSQLK